MRAARRDQITAFVLLAFAAAWVLAVWHTVPPGAPGTVGPRAFPLGLGFVLGGLALLLLACSYWKGTTESDERGPTDASEEASSDWLHSRMVLATFVMIVAYGFLMEKAGFALATLLTVLVMTSVVLKIRNPITVVGLAAGLTFGCWLVFGKILGAYLPPGTWLSLL